jgi:hypothetical protein
VWKDAERLQLKKKARPIPEGKSVGVRDSKNLENVNAEGPGHCSGGGEELRKIKQQREQGRKSNVGFCIMTGGFFAPT